MKRIISTLALVAFQANTGAATGTATEVKPEEGKAPETAKPAKEKEEKTLAPETEEDRTETGHITEAVTAEIERLIETGMDKDKAEFAAVTIVSAGKFQEMGEKRISIERSSRAMFYALIARPEFKMFPALDGSPNINKWLEKVWAALPDDKKTPADKNPTKFYNYNTAEKLGNPMARGVNSLGAWMKRNSGFLFPDFVKVIDEGAKKLQALLKACELIGEQEDLPETLRKELWDYYNSKKPQVPEKKVESEKAA